MCLLTDCKINFHLSLLLVHEDYFVQERETVCVCTCMVVTDPPPPQTLLKYLASDC